MIVTDTPGWHSQLSGRSALYSCLMIEDVAHWPSGTVRIVWHGGRRTTAPVTGAHGFCFRQGKVLVCDIGGRGSTIPGGHLQPGESPADCLVREAAEEACVDLGRLELLGFIEADHSRNERYDGRYPVRSVQAIFRADVTELRDFRAAHESAGRRLVTPAELPAIHHEWNRVLQAGLDAALRKAKVGDDTPRR